MSAFSLDPRLEADTIALGDLELCSVRLMNDARFPWLILVPRRADIVELDDLAAQDSQQLMQEARIAVGVMRAVAAPDKVNVAGLGNVVSQFHLHVIGRFASDPAWPGPVWGHGTRQDYPAHGVQPLIDRFTKAFAEA
ncbi:MAG: HIT domain-containing protein [Salinarimonas sp.]|nr:HIT domain-containing protein [Salinarimonas sp.]